MTTLKIEIEELIKEIYHEGDVATIFSLLDKYQLRGILSNTLKTVVEEIRLVKIKPAAERQAIIVSLASTFLSSINNKLSLVENTNEKKLLEVLISDIAFEMLKQMLVHYSGNKAALLNSIDESLVTACEINGFDSFSLYQMFPIRKLSAIASTIENDSKPQRANSTKTIFYDWLGEPYNLDDSSNTLKDHSIIEGVKPFKGLFKPPPSNFQVRFNASLFDEVIVLFDTLNDKGIIQTRGRSGHFSPLKRYAVDFENNFLIQGAPKSIKYAIKKNKQKWKTLNDKVSKWISDFEPEKFT